MSDCYLIDVRKTILVPVIEEADPRATSLELAMAGPGKAGDPPPAKPEIFARPRLEG